ncbi:transposase [Frankia gtarii]|uniref:transposase n=1 Tax=Frankia gtarii TaxID=2950102 RepID=UPI0021C22763|nr:transposase [Frankia gtarii]
MDAGKKTAGTGGWICFVDEAGQARRPPKARTWARHGHTPVMPVMTVSARRSIARFLTAAHHQLDGKIVVVWDNLPGHHARRTQQFIDDHTDWLTVHRLPAHAPKINPVESVWACLQTGPPANLAVTRVEQLIAAIRTALTRIQHRPALLRGFLAGTGLHLEPP